MTDERYLAIDDQLRIPLAELEFKATRSGGPGGQHVNTSSTQVELSWDVGRTTALTEAQRAILIERLSSRLDGKQRLRLVSSTFRSQRRNKDEVLDRLRALVADGLEEPKPRRPTRPSKASREARLKDKKLRGDLKRLRRPPKDE